MITIVVSAIEPPGQDGKSRFVAIVCMSSNSDNATEAEARVIAQIVDVCKNVGGDSLTILSPPPKPTVDGADIELN